MGISSLSFASRHLTALSACAALALTSLLVACSGTDASTDPASGGDDNGGGGSSLGGDGGGGGGITSGEGGASTASKDGGCVGQTCYPPTANDGMKDGMETDVDCGGSGAPVCADGKKCGASTDCESGVCNAQKTCAAPTATDGVKNGNESDVDCGQSGKGVDTKAPACAATKACTADTDCASDGCDYQKKCAVGRSCTALHGGQTCGAGDFNDPKKSHESCCEAVTVPGLTAKVDRYQITSGRMRAFVTRLNGDVKGWVQANRATMSARAQASLPASLDAYLPSDFTGDYGVYMNLGGHIYLTNQPSGSQGCFIGPNNGTYYAGAHTYYLDAAGQAVTGDSPSIQTQDRLDEKSLNCVPYPILAAFCAWDGGFLASREDLDAAWGATTYPWGAAPVPSGYSAAGGTTQTPATGSLLYANWQWNYFRISGDYERTTPADYTAFVAPPGRYPMGVGKVAPIMDLAGNLMEITTTGLGGGSVKWSKNGSFEGHAVGSNGFQFPIMTKYGKAGGRCER